MVVQATQEDLERIGFRCERPPKWWFKQPSDIYKAIDCSCERPPKWWARATLFANRLQHFFFFFLVSDGNSKIDCLYMVSKDHKRK